MTNSTPSPLDVWLERLSKLAGILLPVTIALVGGIYTRNKDRNDEAVRVAQQKRDESQKLFGNTQKQYTNLTTLLPLLASDKEMQVQAGLQIYLSEARVFQAPTDLQSFVLGLSNRFPGQAKLVQSAAEAGQRQQGEECKAIADGVYVHVANSEQQLKLGQTLANRLRAMNVSPPIQGVQRIDQGPNKIELRYYFSDANNNQANEIVTKLQAAGIQDVVKADLSKRYLKRGCPPPAVYELWIGTSTPLTAEAIH